VAGDSGFGSSKHSEYKQQKCKGKLTDFS